MSEELNIDDLNLDDINFNDEVEASKKQGGEKLVIKKKQGDEEKTIVFSKEKNENPYNEKPKKSKRKIGFQPNFSLNDSYTVMLNLAFKPASLLMPLERYTLVNDLYSSRRVYVTLGSKRIPVPSFVIGYVETFAQKDDTNNLYVVITPLQLLMMNPRTRSIGEHEKKVKDILREALQGLLAKEVIKEYSDELRIHYFKELWMIYWKLLNEGKIPKPPFPGWENQHLFRVIDDVIRFSLGFHDFEYLFFDDNVEDIFLNGVNTNIFLQHTKYNYMKTNIIVDYVELHRVVTIIGQMTVAKFNYKRPVIDMQIMGHFNIRVNLTHDSFSIDGYTLTMRKAKETPISFPMLIYSPMFGSLNDELGALLWEFMHQGISALVVGETGSGKTTLLKSLVTTAQRSDRIISLEDTVEFPHYQRWGFHHVRWSARSPLSKTEPDEYDLELASKNILRARPRIVILGEIRYTEARTFFEIIQMGVASAYSTAHGASPVSILRRLIYSMGVEPTSIADLDLIIQMKTFRPINRLIRKITHLSYIEEVGINDEESADDYKFDISTNATIHYEIRNFAKYWFRVNRDKSGITEGWNIYWKKFLGSRIFKKLMDNTGLEPDVIVDEINEKYSILQLMGRNIIEDSVEKELMRSLKLFDMYYIIKRDNHSFGEETFKIFRDAYAQAYPEAKKVKYRELINKDEYADFLTTL